MKRAALYLRVSRDDQDVRMQRDECTALATRRGWAIYGEYADEGISGATTKRPQLRAMLRDARRGRFDVVIAYRYDRLSRSLRELIFMIDELEALGRFFVSVHEGFDTTTPAGRMCMQQIGSFAEFERSVLIERTKSGMDAARRRGAAIGRPRRLVDVGRARSLRANGATWKAIAAELGVGVGTVFRALGVGYSSELDVPEGAPKPIS